LFPQGFACRRILGRLSLSVNVTARIGRFVENMIRRLNEMRFLECGRSNSRFDLFCELLSQNRAAAPTGFNVGTFHRCYWLPQAQFAQTGEYIEVCIKTMSVPRERPGYLAGGVLAN
jgi:hypothetical protein